MADNVYSNQRIIYVEPNDVFDSEADNAQGNLALTPKYEDFCISFNLIIEQYSRYRKSGTTFSKEVFDENNKPQRMMIQWGLKRNDLFRKRTSTLAGTEHEYGYNYLTTYYTDLGFNSYKERDEIEGLGVESVQISYESWYTPTVTIKFVDLRGSAIFGREEAIHIDEKTSMVDNIFGAFFSMPYPLFRLQVKGFFGKPVTYQLTCSGFKGEFNAQTGNFEAVATFIGYSWSLLTDIPFAYLVAAPHDTYYGKYYWDLNVNKPEWGLWSDTDKNDISPIKMTELFERINSELEVIHRGEANEEQSAELRNNSENLEEINELNNYFGKYVTTLLNKFPKYLQINSTGSDSDQILLFSESAVTIDEGEEAVEVSSENNMRKTKELYQKIFNKTDVNPINYSSFKELFINENSNIEVNGINDLSVDELMKIEFDDLKLTRTSAERLLMEIERKNSMIQRYCCLVDNSDVRRLIENKKKEITNKNNDISNEIARNANKSILDIITFKPFIGNVFKLIFCHLETFCHIMFHAASEIDKQILEGKRSPKNLNVNFQDTDNVNNNVYEDEQIPQWPAVYNEGTVTSECGYKSNWKNVYGWVGDFSHNFIEERVVYGLQEGIQIIVENKKSVDKEIVSSIFPIIPYDYFGGKSVFGSVIIDNISQLAGHLGNRIASIIGVFCGNNIDENLAQQIGKLDAYNLYDKKKSVLTYKTILNTGNVNIEPKNLIDIMFCNDDTYAKKDENGNVIGNVFETVQKIDEKYSRAGRHPIFVNDNNKEGYSLYCHYYDEKLVSYVPSTIKEFGNYKEDFIYNGGETNPYFDPEVKDNKSHEWLHTCDSSKIYNLTKQSVELNDYSNIYMFNILNDDSSVTFVKNKYSELKNGNIKLLEYNITDDLNNFADTFLYVSDKEYATYFDTECNLVEKYKEQNQVIVTTDGKYNVIRIEEKEEETTTSTNTNDSFFSKVFFGFKIKDDGFNYTPQLPSFDYKKMPSFYFTSPIISDTSNTNTTDISYDNITLKDFEVFFNNDIKTKCSIFGCPFYYNQEQKMDSEKDDDEYRERVLRSKAYLFLQTFVYSKRSMKMFAEDAKNKKNGTIELVPKAFVLCIGGMLWRKRYYNKHKIDPIVFLSGYKKVNVDNTFICKSDNSSINGKFMFYTQNTPNTYSVNDFLKQNEIDYNYENRFISLFEDFVNSTFKSFSEKYELFENHTTNKISTLEAIIENFIYLKDLKEDEFANTTSYNNWINVWEEILKNLVKKQSFDIYKKYQYGCNFGIICQLNLSTEEESLFKDLYLKPYVVCDGCYRLMGKETSNSEIKDYDKIYVKDSLMEGYLKGFLEAYNSIVNQQTVNIGNENGNMNVSLNTFKCRDLSISIYYYLKNLWDKWLVTCHDNAFDVKDYFDENFVFIDSFYKNVYHYLAINCEKLLKTWNELSDNGSLFHFISRIVSDHGCIFLPVPDYIGFNGNTQEQDIKAMEDLFRPMPYNDMPLPNNNNKFIVMFTHSPSHMKTEQNNFKTDSYDIWSHDIKNGSLIGKYNHLRGITDEAKKLFSSEIKPDEDRKKPLASRYGYNVPSFGIAFGRQNNHLFKNLRLNMDNPVMTEQAIKAQWQIALKGSSDAHSICFIGQDTFNVFANYSYNISVEMMGNAQICPLMYFQLLNVPLWRGTYMIYKVTHSMTPGNMITTIDAMKMNKYAQPFNTAFFTVHVNGKQLATDGNPCDDDVVTTSSGSGGRFYGGKITNPVPKDKINIADKNAYNLVLLRYNNKAIVNRETTYAGVIYDYDTDEVITWTIQSSEYDDVNPNKNPIKIVPSSGKWVTIGAEHRAGASKYCIHVANGSGIFAKEVRQTPSILATQFNNTTQPSGCLFHMGQKVGKLSKGNRWTEGCILCGEKAPSDGIRSNFDIGQYSPDNIITSDNIDVKWYRNFYDKVVPKICSGTNVYLYVVDDFDRGDVYMEGFTDFNNNVSTKEAPSGLVPIRGSLPDDLKDLVIINALYSKDGSQQNFGNCCMPGYKPGQTELWIGQNTMKMFENAVRYMNDNYNKTTKKYKLMIWDAYRPQKAAKAFFEKYKANNKGKLTIPSSTKCLVNGCPYKNENCSNTEHARSGCATFIARVNDSGSTSPHCKGRAIDLTLADYSTGKPILMVKNGNFTCPWAINTYFDEFSNLSNTSNLNAEGNTLKTIMTKGGGFRTYSSEYWHYTGSDRDNNSGAANYDD